MTKREKGSSQSRTCRWAANVVEEQHLDWLQSLELCHLLYLLSFLCTNVLYFHDPPFLLVFSFLLFNFILTYSQLSWPCPSDYFWLFLTALSKVWLSNWYLIKVFLVITNIIVLLEVTVGVATDPWTARNSLWQSGQRGQWLPHSCGVQHWARWARCTQSF